MIPQHARRTFRLYHTGNLTLGNYMGAVINWKAMQQDYDCFYFIAGLYALTVA
jgi:tryptophanyl-tRNA synthetase